MNYAELDRPNDGRDRRSQYWTLTDWTVSDRTLTDGFSRLTVKQYSTINAPKAIETVSRQT